MFTRNYSGTGSRLGKRIYLIGFIVFALLMAGAMIYGMSQNSNRERDTQTARQEISIIEEGGKIVLTDELLRSDYSVFARTTEISTNIFFALLVGMAALFLFGIGTSVFSLIKSLRAGESGTNLIIRIAGLVVISIILIFGAFILGSGLLSTGSMRATEKDKATFKLSICEVTSKDTEKVTKHSGKRRSTVTYYYIYLKNGTRLSVDSFVYNQVDAMGTYYLAQNDQDKIFSLYPSWEYCLPGDIDEEN